MYIYILCLYVYVYVYVSTILHISFWWTTSSRHSPTVRWCVSSIYIIEAHIQIYRIVQHIQIYRVVYKYTDTHTNKYNIPVHAYILNTYWYKSIQIQILISGHVNSVCMQTSSRHSPTVRWCVSSTCSFLVWSWGVGLHWALGFGVAGLRVKDWRFMVQGSGITRSPPRAANCRCARIPVKSLFLRCSIATNLIWIILGPS